MENDIDNYMNAPTNENKLATVEAMNTRQMQEVKGMVFMAKQFPRSLPDAYRRIMMACERKVLAENAAYEFPRGDQRVTGPSIRLAEVLAQNWGNMDSGIVELEQRPGESTAMSYCWDLETNVRQTKIFTVKHERHTKKGVTKLTDPRDIYEIVANQGSRRLRSCILAVIPGDIVDKAMQKCQKTLMGDTNEPLSDRLNEVLVAFTKGFQVTIEMIEKNFGYNIAAFTEQDLIKLKRIGTSLKDGMGKREDYFEVSKKTTAESSSSIIDDFEKHLSQEDTKKGGTQNATEQGELPLT